MVSHEDDDEIFVSGLHGWDCLRQVHQAHKQGGDDPVQHQRPGHSQERELLPPL